MFRFTRVAVLMASLLFVATSFAQPAPDYDNGPDAGSAANAADAPDDPPARVARLSLIDGPVSFVPAGENDWVEAVLNRPLISGDKLWTDRGARAELEIGDSAIRVDQLSSFNFLNLDDRTAQVELTQGTLNLRVRHLDGNQIYEIDTPTLAFVINRVGEYRIDVAPDGNGTMVTVFHGAGDAYGEDGARFRVEEGESIRFNDPRLRDFVSDNVPSPDDFDRFCFERDGRWDNSPSRQYLSEEVIGYDDLDSNGSWSSDADYGSVWYPNEVAADWAPYSYGHWAWIGAYGWTWIDSAPWGFAPFHYGRWAYIHNRWGWCPGPVHVRPYYAPALVAFIGGGGLRVGFSGGAPVGWFPLGPRDVYVPGYRTSRDYFAHVNESNARINATVVNNFYGNYSRGNFDYGRVSYANRNIAGAVTAVPGDVFVGARPIRGSALAINRQTFANARVSGFAAIAPTPASLAFAGRRTATAPPRAIVNRNIIAATRPPAPIASFAQGESLLRRDPGRALPFNQLRTGPSVLGNGQQAQREARATRPNVNVVTLNGQPARSLAPAIAPRSTLNPSRVENGRGPALRENPQRQGSEAESHTVSAPPAGLPAAVTQGPNALPSARYANPSAISGRMDEPQNGRAPISSLRTPPNNAPVQDTGRNAIHEQRENGAPQSLSAPVEHPAQKIQQPPANAEFRSTPVEHQPPPQVGQREQVQERQVQQQMQQRAPQEQQQRIPQRNVPQEHPRGPEDKKKDGREDNKKDNRDHGNDHR